MITIKLKPQIYFEHRTTQIKLVDELELQRMIQKTKHKMYFALSDFIFKCLMIKSCKRIQKKSHNPLKRIIKMSQSNCATSFF